MSTASFDLRLLEPFVVLADEELHFRGAARRLGIGEPGLSRQIARLQRQLRTALLVRDERRSLLTPAGSRFLAHARTVLRRARALPAELPAACDTLRLHLGIGTHRGSRELVTAFLTAYPDARVEIAEGASSDAVRSVQCDTADVVFELVAGCPPDLQFEALDHAPLGLLTGPDHPVARRGSARWDDLAAEHILVSPAPDDTWNDLLRECLADAGVTVIEQAASVSRIEYLVPTIASGSASLIAGRSMVDPVPEKLVWTALTPHRCPAYGMMWDPRHDRPAVQRFIDFARRRTAGLTTAAAAGTPAPDRPAPPAPPRSDFDLRLVLPFVTVAEEMHFGRAAGKLVIAQPALSRQVARLESQLGVKLLERSHRTMELTAAGQLAFAAGREILDGALRAQMSVESEQRVTGRLVFHPSYAAHPVLARLMGTFAGNHRDIEVAIYDGGTLTAAEAILAGRVDMGVGFGRAVPAGLSYLKFDDVEQGFQCAETHRLAGRPAIRWHDLEGERLLVAADGLTDEYNAWLRAKLTQHGVTVVEVTAPGNRAPLMLNTLLEGGLGAVMAPYHFRAVPQLRWLPFEEPECIEQGMLWNDTTTNPAARAFLHWMTGTVR